MRLDKLKNKDGGRAWPEDKTGKVADAQFIHDINRGFNRASRQAGSLNLKCDVEKIWEFLLFEMDSRERKPDYIFHNKFYPSSGIERMDKQSKQLKELADRIALHLSEWLYVEEEK